MMIDDATSQQPALLIVCQIFPLVPEDVAVLCTNNEVESTVV
jgi:hypothetical protein